MRCAQDASRARAVRGGLACSVLLAGCPRMGSRLRPLPSPPRRLGAGRDVHQSPDRSVLQASHGRSVLSSRASARCRPSACVRSVHGVAFMTSRPLRSSTGCSNCARGLQAWHAVVRCEGVRACGAASVRRREFRGRRHRHKPRRLEDGAKPRRANSWKRANLQSLTDKPAGGSTARSLRLAARNGHTTMRRRAAEDRKGAGRHDGRLATNVCCRCIAPLKTRLPPSQARASSSASIVDFVSCPLNTGKKSL